MPRHAQGTELVLQALRFAAERHRDHRRKGDIAAPYINHPIAVAEQLAAAGLAGDAEMLAAAVLHDVIEDAEVSQAELERQFGGRVAAIVAEVTDDPDLMERQRKRLVEETIGGKSEAARLVKLSDLIANVTDIVAHPPHWSRERTLHYIAWAERVVRAMRGVHPALERLFAERAAQAREAHPPTRP
ncbi:MAG: bifunctional (p)ppGpp synthetase/guanosine-3',5'-bis(diphosphate) 3'-pyrophosphohydrolase [Candidatus Lambdaproteobacteria bacterium]|nr:bifunctional (p)ppGpp synthetase/guanosine-3',5'-bis(diphosphate) 3'-pyrophosphohydrolase [Candidatus Lambdaproteobacteria bacterium]